MVGDSISHYRILGELGRGGMGVVYEAEDLKLGRRVALKFLPRELAGDPQAMERFQFEARAASALNHENICTIFEIDEADGQPFMAMELLRGEPLSERLTRPLPLDAVLELGAQVADALEAAHHAGFVHRDIKPANIFVTDRGRVKILDFGLAKLAREHRQTAALAGVTIDDKRAALLTSPGSTVGTVAYMSPEQARGEELDGRSDLFSFGAVLYQMSTAALPFDGPTAPVIFHAILEKNPPPPSQLQPSLPLKFDEIVLKALEKDRDLRYQTAGEMRADLKRLRRDTSSARMQVATPVAAKTDKVTAAEPAQRRKLSKEIMGGLAALALSAVVLLVGFVVWRSQQQQHSINPQTMTIRPLTENSRVVNAVISGDGKWIAYIMREQERSLWVKQIATGSDFRVLAPQPGLFGDITFSPDGNYIYYVHSRGEGSTAYDLYSVPSLGGAPRRIIEKVNSGVSFSSDGRRLVFVKSNLAANPATYELTIADADGSNPTVIFTRSRDGFAYRSSPAWGSLNNLVAISTAKLAPDELSEILVLTPEGKPVGSMASPFLVDGITWMPDGSGMILKAKGKNPGQQEYQLSWQPYPSGEVVRITNDLNEYGQASVTADGRTFVAAQARLSGTVFAGPAPAQLGPHTDWQLRAITSEQANANNLAWTGAGNLAVQEGAYTFLLSPDGSSRTHLLPGQDISLNPRACGNGDQVVVFRVGKNNDLGLWLVDRENGVVRQLTPEKEIVENGACTRDGATLVYRREGPDQNSLIKIPVGGGPPQLLAKGLFDGTPAISPDGTLLASLQYKRQGGTQIAQIAVLKLADGSLVKEFNVPPRTDGIPNWTPDGRAVTYAVMVGSIENIYMLPLDGSPAVQITHFDWEPGTIPGYGWSRDGKQFAYTHRKLNNADAVLFSGYRQ
jgi:serine/threonine protein kinase/Tol biopolymer transport system component